MADNSEGPTGDARSPVGVAARRALELGLKPVLVKFGSKKPSRQNWETLEYDHENVREFDDPRYQIGLRWGEGHIDVDLESETAAAVADFLLPKTEFVWGRPGNSRAHRIYRTEGLGDFTRLQVKNVRRTLVVELRGRHCQSVIPPSVHPSGVQYEWVGAPFGTPSVGVVEDLGQAVVDVAIATELANLWPTLSGTRHDAMLGVCGMMVRAGRSQDVVQAVCDAVVEVGKDPDPVDRRSIPGGTARRAEEGDEPVAGYRMVEGALGTEFARWLAKLLRVRAERLLGVGGLTFNDLGNSREFCRLYFDDVRWLSQGKQWIAWDGCRWSRVGGELIVAKKAAGVTDTLMAKAETLPSAPERAALRAHAIKSGNVGAQRAMVELSRAALMTDDREFDVDSMLFNCPNGTIELKRGEFRENRPSDMITRVCGVEYDYRTECSRWVNFLSKTFGGDDELIGFVKRMAGYCMTGSTSEQCLFFFYGDGKNGKTTLIEVLSRVMGEYATRAQLETLLKKKTDGGIPNDVAKLAGARFVAAREMEEGARLAEGVIKDLTGGDTISARFLNHEFFDFVPTMKLIIYGNHKPEIRGSDDGIWRRMRLVPFLHKVAKDEEVMEYHKVLVEEEGPAILRWCLEGCLEWLKDGLGTPRVVEEATKDYREEMDVFGDYASLYEVTVSKAWTSEYDNEAVSSDRMPIEDVYSRYMSWCVTNGERQMPQRWVVRKWMDRGVIKKRIRGRWVLEGLKERQIEVQEW